MHVQCPFVDPSGACLLPQCFQAPSTPLAFCTDVQHVHGVFKLHLPTASLVLYVPPVATLRTADRTVFCHVVASWWWLARHTLFIQVYMSEHDNDAMRVAATLHLVAFPLTCVDHAGNYHIHPMCGSMVKTKHKTE